MNLEIFTHIPRFSDAIELMVIQPGEGFYYAGELTMKKREHFTPAPPTMTINKKAAQQLMDELWKCGLRPTEGSGSAGSLAATQRHLEDMRALVFKTPPK